MGKEKDKKKSKGTDTKQKSKKKESVKEEDDIESMVKAIEEEEKKRQEVKEVEVVAPSNRSSFSMTTHLDNPEIIFFGGEFYNGQKTAMFKDLLIYDLSSGRWRGVRSPAGPPPRAGHQAAMVNQAGGQLWIFGGEFTSPTESQFYHYRDLWCFHFATRRWEKVEASGAPSARSGHRMVVIKKWLVLFGGFHDNLRESKYFNDVYTFDLENRVWKRINTSGIEPSPRSACQMFPTGDGRVAVFGGYCKEKGKKGKEKGVRLEDMFLLIPDETGVKWQWQGVKQVGQRPSVRTGLSTAVGRDRVYMFGGVADQEEPESDSDEDEDDDADDATFHNDLYSVTVEEDKATWSLLKLTETDKKKKKKTKEVEGELEKMEEMVLEEGESKLASESDLSFLSSLGAAGGVKEEVKGDTVPRPCPPPSPRFNAGLVYKAGSLYLFGGLWEKGEKDFTLKDFYSLDTEMMDSWTVLIEDDVVKSMDWVEEEDDDDEDDEEDEEEDSNAGPSTST